MKIPEELQPLAITLRALQRLIDEFEGQGIIIGGVAVSLLGKPRFTADADAVIFLSIVELPRLVRLAQAQGFEPRYPNFQEFAHTNRILLLRHRETGITADISLGALPFEAEAIQRSQIVSVGGLRLRIPSVEDLIILKAIAHRPKDYEDIESLLAGHPDLDRARIRNWVQQFADLMEMPELFTDLEPLLHNKPNDSRSTHS
jgi:hypothetical protein